MNHEVSLQDKLDWKAIGQTIGISAIVGASLIALTEFVIKPAIKKLKEKKAANKIKETKGA